MALGGAAWRNETRAWRRAMLKTPRPNTGGTRARGRPRMRLMDNMRHGMNKMEVRGTRARGRPRMRLMDNMKHGMNKMEVRGTRARGRPRMRLVDNMRHGMNKCGLEEGDAQDRR